MNSLRNDAERVSLMLQYGLITGQAVVDWADSRIIVLDSPPPALIELSTTPASRTADLLSHLSALGIGADYWQAFRMILGLLYECVASHPERTERLASEIYTLMISAAPTWRATPNRRDMPKDFEFLLKFGDDLELAEMGARGEPEAVVKRCLTELRAFERFKEVPAGLVVDGRTEGGWPIGFGPQTNPKPAAQAKHGISGAKKKHQKGKKWWRFW